MEADATLIKIFNQIKVEVKEKFNLELNIQEIVEVINTQLEATKLGFNKKISVSWFRFCKFVFTNRSTRKKEVKKELLVINTELDYLPAKDREALEKDAIIRSAEEKRQLLSEKGKTIPNFTLTDVVKDTSNLSKDVVLFKSLNNKKSK